VRLGLEAEAQGFRLLTLEVTGSTNEDALSAAREGDPGGLWIVAAEQRAGRGRHGRAWSSPAGNLHASLLLVEPCEPAAAPQLGFVAGLALHQAVEAVTGLGAPRLALKWPNDLLLDGAKVSGLLLEGHTLSRGGGLATVIGFGVNLATAPAGTPYPAARLQSLRPELTREALFKALTTTFARNLAVWTSARRTQPADSFAAIRRLWLERAAGVGAGVTLRLPGGERRGTFAGLDGAGRLQLRTPAGLELIDAGDLYFPDLFPETAELGSTPTGS
jgi:BirA family biotin operon repressor/biotin-[acetyl-CoA-carboxylase] ligase